MGKVDGDLQRAFRAVRHRDSLRALQGRDVAVEIKGRALHNLAKHNLTYPGDEEALFSTLCIVACELVASAQSQTLELRAIHTFTDNDVPTVVYLDVMVFASSASVLAALSMLRNTEAEPLAVQCRECDGWFRSGDYYDLTEHGTELYLCHGCIVAMTAEELIEGYLL